MTEKPDVLTDQPVVQLTSRTREKTRKPNMYKVFLVNDDYTPMEFVVHMIQEIFHRDEETATRIMLNVHQQGIGLCGIYTYEIAETKVTQVIDLAQQNDHPLQCTMEKE